MKAPGEAARVRLRTRRRPPVPSSDGAGATAGSEPDEFDQSACSPMPSLLHVKDLKAMFPDIGLDSIYGLLRSGEIPNRKVAGKLVTTPEAVQNWLNSITNGIDMGGPRAVSKGRES